MYKSSDEYPEQVYQNVEEVHPESGYVEYEVDRVLTETFLPPRNNI